MKKLDKKDISCKFEKRWQERHPYGSTTAEEEMWECECPAEEEKMKAIGVRIDSLKPCGCECPGYEPVVVNICNKHGEFTDYCDGCENEFYEEMEQERRD